MNSLVLGGTGFVGRRLVEVLVAEGNPVTVLNRGVTSVELPPGVDRLVADRSASKITTALGVMPSYDLRAGHANTLEWYQRSGAAAVENALSDPLWNRTFDFSYEAEVAAHVRNAPLRKDA